MKTFLAILGGLVFFVAAAFATIFIRLKVYNIVLLPLGAPVLGMWQMWGISFFFSLFSHIKVDSEKRGKYAAFKDTLASVIGHLLSWGIAYLIFG